MEDLNQKNIRVLIIGAGPAGLATIRHLKDYFTVECFDAQKSIGGQWSMQQFQSRTEPEKSQYRNLYGYDPISTYENMLSNIPRACMTYKDFPSQIPAYQFITIDQYHEYLNQFSSTFNLSQYIQLNKLVSKFRIVENLKEEEEKKQFDLEKCEEKEKRKFVAQIVDNDDASQYMIRFYDYIFVCNGHFSVPQFPNIPGKESFKGEILHSHFFKGIKAIQEFKGQNILLLGFGPSAQEILGMIVEQKVECQKIYQCGVNSFFLPFVTKSDYFKQKIDDGTLQFYDTSLKEVNQEGQIILSSEKVIQDIDLIILCTGYKLSFPFIDDKDNIINRQVIDDERSIVVGPLYQGMVSINCTEVMFIGLHTSFMTVFFQRQAIFARQSIQRGQDQFFPSKQEMENEFNSDLSMAQMISSNGNNLFFFQPQGSPLKPQFNQYCRELADLLGMQISSSVEQYFNELGNWSKKYILQGSIHKLQKQDLSMYIQKDFTPPLIQF